MSMFCAVVPKTIYKALPNPIKDELALKTGKQYAAQSAYHLYTLLANPEIVRQLPKEMLANRINGAGQVALPTRLALTLNHFYSVLTSRLERFGKQFARLVQHPELGARKIEEDARKLKQEIQQALAEPADSKLGRELQAKLREKTPQREEWLKLFRKNQDIEKAHKTLKGEIAAHDKKRPPCPWMDGYSAFLGLDDFYFPELAHLPKRGKGTNLTIKEKAKQFDKQQAYEKWKLKRQKLENRLSDYRQQKAELRQQFNALKHPEQPVRETSSTESSDSPWIDGLTYDYASTHHHGTHVPDTHHVDISDHLPTMDFDGWF